VVIVGIIGVASDRSVRCLTWTAAVAAAVCWSALDAEPANSQALEESTVPRTIDELRVAVAKALEDTGTAGASVVLVSKDEVLWSGEFGLADRESKRPVTPETMFRAGSISKSFVALAVLKLVEEGKLKLDDPIRPLVGDVEVFNRWEKTDPVRLVHLLEHTAGFDDIAMREYLADDPGISLHEALMVRPQTRTSRWPPGRFFSYSNIGAPVAAYAVERVVGKPFEEYVDEEFLRPLGMATASFLPTDSVHEQLATGYRQDDVRVEKFKHIIYRPAGSLCATANELAHLAQLWLNRGEYRGVRLLAPESIDRMESARTSLAAKHGASVGYGLGNFSMVLDGHLFHGHEGSITGYSAMCRYSHELGVGYVVLANTGDFGDALQIEAPVTAYLTRDWEKPDGGGVKLNLAALAGYYEPATPRL
jgi:CubicO group peptidase (beta-lactamase class C family)